MDLKPNGSEIMVTNENKREYIENAYTQPLLIKSHGCLVGSLRAPCSCGHPRSSLGSFPAGLTGCRIIGVERATCIMASWSCRQRSRGRREGSLLRHIADTLEPVGVLSKTENHSGGTRCRKPVGVKENNQREDIALSPDFSSIMKV